MKTGEQGRTEDSEKTAEGHKIRASKRVNPEVVEIGGPERNEGIHIELVEIAIRSEKGRLKSESMPRGREDGQWRCYLQISKMPY